MSEYKNIKQKQAEQLGTIDEVHPMKQVAVMSCTIFNVSRSGYYYVFNRTKCMKELWTEKYRPRA